MSHELHHFTMGLWVFFLACAVSVVGAYVGLSCARRMVEHTTSRGRTGWLVLASLSIGGVAIWLMHFIGMMGFAVPGTVVRYDLGLTAFSLVVAVAATMFGLWLANLGARTGRRRQRVAALAVGGVVMGAAVSLMHYSGMAAIQIQGTLAYEPVFVVTSVIIGVVASTAALWFTSVTERPAVRAAASLVMGAAVVALHYTGMAGVEATVDPTAIEPTGLTVLAMLFPAFVVGMVVLTIPIAALGLVSNAEEVRRDEAVARWTADSTHAGLR